MDTQSGGFPCTEKGGRNNRSACAYQRRLRGACTMGRGCTYETAEDDGTCRHQADSDRIQCTYGRISTEQGFKGDASAPDLRWKSGNR